MDHADLERVSEDGNTVVGDVHDAETSERTNEEDEEQEERPRELSISCHVKIPLSVTRHYLNVFLTSKNNSLTTSKEINRVTTSPLRIFCLLVACNEASFNRVLAEELEDDEVAVAGYEIYYTKAVNDSHVPKLNDTSFNRTVTKFDISVVFFFLPCKFFIQEFK